ncbi:hypothetical protein OXYTRIMIC_715 [Oxytricha trifallax]|uniref:Uncharacterized protein n=1 Tax=Oxytricha trifallax TaxID=1172189 RepID=A0A073HZ93_9SPIT|nr:hypothetical protein OXYTRIMIC_715 [Oxytricha trifallax]
MGNNQVEKGILNCNFNKLIGQLIGQDGFNGEMLAKSQAIKSTVSQKITYQMKEGKFPQCIKDRNTDTTKQKLRERYPEMGNTRPIVVNSHMSKIRENLIINKIKAEKNQLLQTGNYQNGFKENKSTHINLIRQLEHMKEQ